MTVETGVTRNQMIGLINLSPHGDYSQYVPVGQAAAKQDPEFFAHLIAWASRKSEVRDANTALPVLAMTARAANPLVLDNAQAHLAKLDPRNFLKAMIWSRSLDLNRASMRRLTELYLRDRERSGERLERAVLSHGKSLKGLYARFHIKPNALADRLLFKGERVGLLKALADLKNQSPEDAASSIITNKLPFLNVMGALGEKAKDEALVHALITVMSPSELVNNSKMLLSMGLNNSPALRGAYDEKLKAVQTFGKNSLKLGVAAAALGASPVAEKLKTAQEKKLKSMGVEGDWLVLGDKSGSMTESIEASRMIAATLAATIKGKVTLVFFNTSPQKFDVTGKTYEEIKAMTGLVSAGGGTSCGIGLEYAAQNNLPVDGVAIITDGEETSHPVYGHGWKKLCSVLGKEVPSYVYLVKGGKNVNLMTNCHGLGVPLEVFDLTKGIDYFALPNLVQTMRTNKWSLADEIMEVPLLQLSQVLKTPKESVHA